MNDQHDPISSAIATTIICIAIALIIPLLAKGIPAAVDLKLHLEIKHSGI